MRRFVISTAIALACFAAPATGVAQERAHVVSADQLDDIAVAHAGNQAAERAELQAFLDRPEVRQIAADAGIDIMTAETAVAALSADEIRLLSGELARADAALAGGDTLVISTTAIIIALLVVIIILAA